MARSIVAGGMARTAGALHTSGSTFELGSDRMRRNVGFMKKKSFEGVIMPREVQFKSAPCGCIIVKSRGNSVNGLSFPVWEGERGRNKSCNVDMGKRPEREASRRALPDTEPSLSRDCQDLAGSSDEIKNALQEAIKGIDRGIFGVQAAKKEEIARLIDELERLSPLPDPTNHLSQVEGKWRLLYSTITILGQRRTKLGLREFIKLTDFLQIIHTDEQRAENVVSFEVSGLGSLRGSLTIEASYAVSSPSRVDITFLRSSIVPEQLMLLFKKNYDLLLSIFNPEGWLEITYVDDTMRIGRDNKGNIFFLERVR